MTRRARFGCVSVSGIDRAPIPSGCPNIGDQRRLRKGN
jgi:hypothetical protein